MKLLTTVPGIVAIVFLSQTAANVQDRPGGLDGFVADAHGGRLPGVTVSVSSPRLPQARTVISNAAGRFGLAQLAADDYELALSMTGFQTARGRVTVKPGSTSLVTFQMAIGSLTEYVSIHAASPAPPAQTLLKDAPGEPIRVGGDIRAPRKVNDVKPIYPADAQAAGAEGQIRIEAVIGRDGSVARAEVVQGVPLLNTAALQAVRLWRYTPTLLNGQPVEVTMTVTVDFVRN